MNTKTTETFIITRRSKIGFGYCTDPTGRGTEIESTTTPDFTGTPRQVMDQKYSDPVYKSLLSGGCYKTIAFFVKKSGEWRKIVALTRPESENTRYCREIENALEMLLSDDSDGLQTKTVTVEIE